MGRFSLMLATVLVVVAMTASVALAGMRVNSISFRAVTTLDSGSTTLMASGTDSLSISTTASASSSQRTPQGTCVAPCVGLFLHADGTLVGIGRTDETMVVVEATGIPVVTCTNQGGNQAPGQNPPRVTTSGQQQIGVRQITKNGSAPINVTTGLPDGSLPGSQMGCPNDNWIAEIVGIQFTNATVTVYQNGVVTLQETYAF